MPASAQRDNGDLEAKLLVRQWLLAELGGLDKCAVLELFGGLGIMHDAVYVGARKHLAFEKRLVDRPTWLMGNNRLLLPKHVQGWDLYDSDAYDNPWIILGNVARLRAPGTFGMVATCGLKRGLKNSLSNGYVHQKTAMNGLSDCRMIIRWYDDVIRWIMADWLRFGVRPIKVKRIFSQFNADVCYYAMTMEKK